MSRGETATSTSLDQGPQQGLRLRRPRLSGVPKRRSTGRRAKRARSVRRQRHRVLAVDQSTGHVLRLRHQLISWSTSSRHPAPTSQSSNTPSKTGEPSDMAVSPPGALQRRRRVRSWKDQARHVRAAVLWLLAAVGDDRSRVERENDERDAQRHHQPFRRHDLRLPFRVGAGRWRLQQRLGGVRTEPGNGQSEHHGLRRGHRADPAHHLSLPRRDHHRRRHRGRRRSAVHREQPTERDDRRGDGGDGPYGDAERLVNPAEGAGTVCRFEYGTTVAYSNGSRPCAPNPARLRPIPPSLPTCPVLKS